MDTHGHEVQIRTVGPSFVLLCNVCGYLEQVRFVTTDPEGLEEERHAARTLALQKATDHVKEESHA